MPGLHELIIIDLPLVIDPISVIELEPPQRELGQGPNPDGDAARQSHHKRWQDNLEPFVLNVKRVQHLGIERLLAAVEPVGDVAEVGPLVSEMTMLVAAQEVIDGPIEVPHRGISASVPEAFTEIPDKRAPVSGRRVAIRVCGQPVIPRAAASFVEAVGLFWRLDSDHLPFASVETVHRTRNGS
jgi:hypothetical protein